tara:strand:+ start:4150 stop:5409 length:1260 start_codon:yes stop_codon:yes gene_type:complete
VKKALENKITLYFISSIIPFLAVSIFVAELIYTSLGIFFLIYLIINKNFLIYKNIFFKLSIVFYIICVISSLLSKEIFFSLKSSLPFLRFIIFISLICYLMHNSKEFTHLLYKFFYITFILLILFGLADYILKYNNLLILNILDSSNIRLNLPFSDEQKLGSYLVRLYPLFLAIHIFKNNNSKKKNIYFLILTLFASLIILLSGERNSLFFLILIFLSCFFLLNIQLKIKLSFFLLSFLAIFIILLFNNNLSKRIIFDKNNQFVFSKDQIIVFTPQHTAHYKTAFNMFLGSPYVGHGPKMFRISCSEKKYNSKVGEFTGCSNHPHSTYLQLMAETGLVAAIIFSLGFFFISFKLIKHFLNKLFYRKIYLNNYQITLCISALIFFWPFSPAGNFFNNWLLIISSFPIGFYVNEFFLKKNN